MNQAALLRMMEQGLRRILPEPECTQRAQRARELYHQLCQTYRDDPPARKQHTEGSIYAGVALYQALQEGGRTPEEALALTDAIFQDVSQQGAKVLRALLRLPGLYRKVPALFLTAAQKKYPPAAGFQMTFYDVGKYRARFDVTACPYHSTCQALGCPELTTIFCNTDDCCYSNMHPRLRWHRTQTIGRGGTVCDFDIAVTDKPAPDSAPR